MNLALRFLYAWRSILHSTANANPENTRRRYYLHREMPGCPTHLEPGRIMDPTLGWPGLDPNANRRSPARNNPPPLDAIFILFASVALVVLILSFSPVRGAQPFQNLPAGM